MRTLSAELKQLVCLAKLDLVARNGAHGCWRHKRAIKRASQDWGRLDTSCFCGTFDDPIRSRGDTPSAMPPGAAGTSTLGFRTSNCAAETNLLPNPKTERHVALVLVAAFPELERHLATDAAALYACAEHPGNPPLSLRERMGSSRTAGVVKKAVKEGSRRRLSHSVWGDPRKACQQEAS